DLNFSNSPQVLSVIVSGSNNDQPQRILLNKDYATPDQLLDDINSRLQGARAAFEDNKLVISHNNPGAETIIFEEIDDRDLVLGAWQVSTGIDGSQSALKGSVALTSDLDLSSVTSPE